MICTRCSHSLCPALPPTGYLGQVCSANQLWGTWHFLHYIYVTATNQIHFGGNVTVIMFNGIIIILNILLSFRILNNTISQSPNKRVCMFTVFKDNVSAEEKGFLVLWLHLFNCSPTASQSRHQVEFLQTGAQSAFLTFRVSFGLFVRFVDKLKL